MFIFNSVSIILTAYLIVSDCAPSDVWDPNKCEKGCNEQKKCPKNQDCHPISDSNCGVCECSQGYKQVGNNCVAEKQNNCNKGCNDQKSCPRNQDCNYDNGDNNCGTCVCSAGYKKSGTTCVVDKNYKPSTSTVTSTSTSTSTGTSTSTTSTSTSTKTSTSTSTKTTPTPTTTTTTGIPTQGPPPGAVSLDCSAQDCGVTLQSGNASNPMSVRTQVLGTPPPGCQRNLNRGRVVCKTPLANGDSTCYGTYCLPGSGSKSYCICSFDKNGPTCQEEKSGSCSQASGQMPPKGFQSTGKRFVHQNDPDNGAILSRHFAGSLPDCIKLCQWPKGQCGSVNYGQLNGQTVCELLSVEAKKENTLLNAWVKDAPGWTYVCCFMS